MKTEMLVIAAMLAGSVLLDAAVNPLPGRGVRRIGRSLTGLWLQFLIMLAAFGLFLTLTGNVVASGVLALAGMLLLVIVSNAKNRMLGEPLVFSDLVLIASVFRHPQFYLSALRAWQALALALAAAIMALVLGWQFVAAMEPHLVGAAVLAGSVAVLVGALRHSPLRGCMPCPDAINDVRRHGLLPTLLVYWWRWRDSADPVPPPPRPRRPAPAPDTPELVVVIQCESFADPVDLFGDAAAVLPGLAAAREAACLSGRLEVSGFGAYTMRTEFGLLFGRGEAALGFRRFDPFLTALREAAHALPHRLGKDEWRSLFLHPHDMRFYGRDRIMPASGFAELVGEERFAPPTPEEGRYVTDRAMADEILAQARAASGPTLLYAVTIANHGPWAADGSATREADAAGRGLADGYLHLVKGSDAMLTTLMTDLAGLGRPAMLVFFGDHRPSIPGISMPGGERHTPYVMVRFDGAGNTVPGERRTAHLTPADLHHAILDALA